MAGRALTDEVLALCQELRQAAAAPAVLTQHRRSLDCDLGFCCHVEYYNVLELYQVLESISAK